MSPVLRQMSPSPLTSASAIVDGLHQSPVVGEVPESGSYLIFRVGSERFGLQLTSVAEALEAPVVMEVAGLAGRSSSYVEWRGRRLPLVDARVPFGIENGIPCAVALILQDLEETVAVAVDELCEVRELALSALRPFAGRSDEQRIVRSVAVEEGSLTAILNPAALHALVLAEARAAGPLLACLARPGGYAS